MNEMPEPLTTAQASQTMSSLSNIFKVPISWAHKNQAGSHLKEMCKISGPGDKATKLKTENCREQEVFPCICKTKNSIVNVAKSLIRYFISPYFVF